MNLLVIDGHNYSVPIIKYSIEPQILDSEGTSRTAAVGWEMVRGPQGTLINLNVTIGLSRSADPEFVALFKKIMSLGVKEFVKVQVILPVGELLTQDMYASPKNIELNQVTKNGIVYSGSWDIFFGARKAYLT